MLFKLVSIISTVLPPQQKGSKIDIAICQSFTRVCTFPLPSTPGGFRRIGGVIEIFRFDDAALT